MKTFIAPAAIALLAAVAAPAAAQQVSSGALGAIAHFNQDHDSQDDRVVIVPGSGVGLSTRSGAFSEAQARFNLDFDGQDDLRRTSGGTIVSGAPDRAQTIFARIAAESAENE